MTGALFPVLVVAPVLALAAAHRPRHPAVDADRGPSWWHEAFDRRRAARVHREAEQVLPDTIDLIVLAVRSGLLPLAALRLLHPHLAAVVRDPVGDVVAAADQGTRFADALPLLAQRLGPALHPLVDGFVAADRDGLPLAPLLERLSADARAQRRRRIDALARELPVRLAAPLVLCSLPAFVLLAVVPLLLAAFASLHR
ncbi:MAG: putative type secretion system protein [Actinomycetota bacterium]|jgi:Flp pilus assembly protein TadB